MAMVYTFRAFPKTFNDDNDDNDNDTYDDGDYDDDNYDDDAIS